MKCTSCGGALSGSMTYCPFCGVRREIDLRQLHFREMSDAAVSLPCPGCESPLQVIEVGTEPPLQVERCGSCHGLFFNPGELEAVLNHQTEVAVRLDAVMIDGVNRDFGHQEREIFYRKCPFCAERMSHLNFGGRSGVILDKCGTHGIWLDGGEFRRLAEWWRAGGKLIHHHHETERAGKLFLPQRPAERVSRGGSVEPSKPVIEWGQEWWSGELIVIVLRILGSLLTR